MIKTNLCTTIERRNIVREGYLRPASGSRPHGLGTWPTRPLLYKAKQKLLAMLLDGSN